MKYKNVFRKSLFIEADTAASSIQAMRQLTSFWHNSKKSVRTRHNLIGAKSSKDDIRGNAQAKFMWVGGGGWYNLKPRKVTDAHSLQSVVSLYRNISPIIKWVGPKGSLQSRKKKYGIFHTLEGGQIHFPYFF